ncbi:MAG: SOS response-associated peptidase [Steroidobacteraceae bacterium]
MCGRYILAQLEAAERAFGLGRLSWTFAASYNIAPTQSVPVVRLAVDGVREGVMMRWGLIPFFARGEPPKYSTINATVEKIETGPCWRGPWTRGQRCILPASSFYEWHVNADGTKQPFAIEVADQPVFGFAGLWDRSVRTDGTAVESCTIITLPASKLMAEIHNAKQRMPAVLRPEDTQVWLCGTAAEAKTLLVQYPDELLHAYRVSARVNSPKNNDAALLQPLPA